METVNLDNLKIQDGDIEYIFRDDGVSDIMTDIISLNSQYAVDVS